MRTSYLQAPSPECIAFSNWDRTHLDFDESEVDEGRASAVDPDARGPGARPAAVPQAVHAVGAPGHGLVARLASVPEQ